MVPKDERVVGMMSSPDEQARAVVTLTDACEYRLYSGEIDERPLTLMTVFDRPCGTPAPRIVWSETETPHFYDLHVVGPDGERWTGQSQIVFPVH